MLNISALTKHTHFHKRLLYSSIKKCNVIFIILFFFLSIHIFGAENIGQISICPIIMLYYVFSLTMLTIVCFVVHFYYFRLKIIFDRMWRDDYLHYCSVKYIIRKDISFYIGISHVSIVAT